MSDAEDGENAEANESDCQEPTEAGDDSFTAADEYLEAFGSPKQARVIAEDGLPKPVIDDVLMDAHAPPFLPESNQCCAAILTSFVIRDHWGDILATFPPDKVERAPNGRYRAKLADAVLPEDNEKKGYARALMEHTEIGSPNEYWTEVHPLRPECKHLLLQLRPPAPSTEHILQFGELQRYCMVRRTTSGAFMSLSNEAMRACSMRDPVDVAGSAVLSEFDEQLATKSRERTYHPMFKQKPPAKKNEQTKEADLSVLEAATAAIIEGATKT